MSRLIPVSEPVIGEKEIEYVTAAVKSGWVSSIGKYIEEFESGFASFIGTKYAATTSNGTTALHLALAAMGIKEGDEVIVPDFTFVATANAVVYTGAKPVFADIDPETWCIDPDSVKSLITERTKAIIPVHIYGHPADMEAINRLAANYGIRVVEDVAEAHGAECRGKRVGSLGVCGVFSFYGNKIITTGEGGMITTDDENLFDRIRYLRDHAMSKEKRYWHTETGYNYRMTNIQAALGCAQLQRIDEIIERKREIFGWYREALSGVEGIKLNPQKEWAKNVYWMICLVLENEAAGETARDEFMRELRERGVDSRPFFHPLSQMPMFKAISNGMNQTAAQVSQRGLNLPSSAAIDRASVEKVATEVRNCLGRV
jgi:perosamine synthetase